LDGRGNRFRTRLLFLNQFEGNIIEPDGSRGLSPAAEETVDHQLADAGNVKFTLQTCPVVGAGQGLGLGALQPMDVQQSAAPRRCSDIFGFDPAGQAVSPPFLNRNRLRPGRVGPFLMNDFGTHSAAAAFFHSEDFGMAGPDGPYPVLRIVRRADFERGVLKKVLCRSSGKKRDCHEREHHSGKQTIQTKRAHIPVSFLSMGCKRDGQSPVNCPLVFYSAALAATRSPTWEVEYPIFPAARDLSLLAVTYLTASSTF